MSINTLFGSVAVCVATLHVSFFFFLKKRHPDEWRRIGVSSIVFQDILGSWKMMSYTLMGRFGRLHDVSLVCVGRILQSLQWLTVLGLVGFLFLYLYSVFVIP